jgi:hypothetical protein
MLGGGDGSMFSISNIFKALYDPDAREEMKNELVYYLVLVFVLGGVCFVVVLLAIMFLTYLIFKMKESFKKKSQRFVGLSGEKMVETK